MKRPGPFHAALFVLCAFVQVALADESAVVPAEVQAEVNSLVEEVMGRAANNEAQKNWTRSVIGRALERAGGGSEKPATDSALPARQSPSGNLPLPAERHASSVAKGLSGREASAEVLIFMSLSIPGKAGGSGRPRPSAPARPWCCGAF